MTLFLFWYLLFALLGIIAFPLVFKLFPGVAGRGYAFSRIAGFLLWGYIFWLFGVLGLLRNDIGGILFSLALVTGVSIIAMTRIGYEDLHDWWMHHKGMVLIVELLFLVAFGFWTYIRALNPEITATEKPMELAFLNAILQSPTFPPADPWLSGYSISYYYFGYVLIGMVSMLTGTPAGIGFNLGIALVFALTAVGAYGVLYALLKKRSGEKVIQAPVFALFGPVFVLLVSNLEGFLDMLHARGLFWIAGPDGGLVSGFWKWLDIKDLVNAPAQPFTWLPQRFLWWWRASRVVNDVSFTGGQQEVIDEFPFFSFLLSDLHPHVLAIPFVMLAIGLVLNFYLSEPREGLTLFGKRYEISMPDFTFSAITMGALAFLNTWDFPIYVGLFTAAYILKRVGSEGWQWHKIVEGAILGVILGLAGVVLYLPFYFGFSSQAGGILPNVLNPTRGAHLWVMFGGLFVPLILYFLYTARLEKPALRRGFLIGFGVVCGLWILSLLLMVVVYFQPDLLAASLESIGANNASVVLREMFSRRFGGFGGWLTLALMLSAAAALILRARSPREDKFVLLMVVIGLLLVIGPEFLYLRDLFGTRMNTIFKFYYQAWILMSLGAAYAAVRIFRDWRSRSGAIASIVFSAVLLMGLTYPVLSLYTKTDGFDPSRGVNLDGTTHSAYLTQDDRAAVGWLLSSGRGIMLEAVGGSYSSAGRIATHTGYPNVLGWVFHQGQWRGGYEEVGSREADVSQIYETGSWEDARTLLEQYDVDYVYVGSLERTSYRVNEAKFRRNLPVLFEQGGVVIYGVEAVR